MDKIVPKPIELYLVEKTYIFRLIMRNFHIIMHNVRETPFVKIHAKGDL